MDNIKTKYRMKSVKGIRLNWANSGLGPAEDLHEHGNVSTYFIKIGEFLHQMRDFSSGLSSISVLLHWVSWSPNVQTYL